VVNQAKVLCIQDGQRNRTKVNLPPVLISLFKANVFTGQGNAEINLVLLPDNIPLRVHLTSGIAVGIGDLRQAEGVSTV